jgi:putative membrane protein
MLMKPSDHDRIRAAIEAAETRTSGEICGVLAHECSQYWEVPLAWAAGAALVLPAVGLIAGLRPEGLFAPAMASWTAAQGGSADAAVVPALIAYAVIQAVVFVVAALVVSIPMVRRLLTPRSLKRERVHRLARELFAVRGLHLPDTETGVLIFASMSERMAEVVADHRIAAKVAPEVWGDVVAALTQGMKTRDPGAGFAAAIQKAGDHLAVHFPRQADDVNALPDTVIELEF